jgi:hypothetical protein
VLCVGVPGLLCVGNGVEAQVKPGEVISETDLGRVELRLRQPQQIGAGSILIELLEIDDYRVPLAAGAVGPLAGFATASIAGREGDRSFGPLHLSTTAEYGQPRSVTLPMPVTNVLRPSVEYQIALESIDPPRTLQQARAPANVVVALRVTRRQKAPDLEVRGDLSRLSRSDASFIEYWGTIAFQAFSATEQGLPFKYLSAKESEKERTTGEIVASGKTLRLIKGFSATLDPNSLGPEEMSFYKSDTNEYFFRQAGGCEAYQDQLFGPFRESDAGFSAADKR